MSREERLAHVQIAERAFTLVPLEATVLEVNGIAGIQTPEYNSVLGTLGRNGVAEGIETGLRVEAEMPERRTPTHAQIDTYKEAIKAETTKLAAEAGRRKKPLAHEIRQHTN